LSLRDIETLYLCPRLPKIGRCTLIATEGVR
jgi:hypothetical protein